MSISINSAISAYNNAAKITYTSNANMAAPADNVTISAAAANQSPFAALVQQSIGGAMDSLRKAENVTMGNLVNQADITDVVTALSKAESTLKTVTAVRDKLVMAWQDLEKMPI